VHWREVELELVQQSACLCRLEVVIEGRRLVGVHVVEYQLNTLDIRIVLGDERLNDPHPILCRTAIGHHHFTPALEGFEARKRFFVPCHS
jgi:hypothetical protein